MQLSAIDATPPPTTSGTGTAISGPQQGGGWLRHSFLEVTGPATSGTPFPYAFGSKDDAIAAARSLSHGIQPALAVLYDSASGPRGTTPWVVQALQLASPREIGFVKRNGDWHQAAWRVDTEAVDLEGDDGSTMREFVSKAQLHHDVVAVVDGSTLIRRRPRNV